MDDSRETTYSSSLDDEKAGTVEGSPTLNSLQDPNDVNPDEKGAVDLDPPHTPEYLSGYPLYMVITAICLAGFLYSLDVTIIVTAIPVITTHFHSTQDIGWYGSAYLITLCSCSLLVGKIYQHYNSKATFFVFVVLFEIGSLICGVAPSSTALILGRAVAGMGGSGLFVGALTIVALATPSEKRPQTMSMVYGISMLGMVTGPIIGGALTQRVSWRWCFYINLPAGAVALLAIAFIRIPDSKSKAESKVTLFEMINRLDPVGFMLFAPTCVMILLALEWGGTKYAWNSSTIIGLFVGFAATAVTFVFWEYHRGDTAMVPLRILRQRVVYSSCLSMVAQFGSVQAFSYYLPVWFQTILGVSPILSGVYFLATAGPLVAMTIISGILVGKIANPAIFAILGNAIAAIGCGLLSILSPSSSKAAYICFQLLAGFGRGISLQQPVNAVQKSLQPSMISVGSSMVLFAQFFGGAIFLALAETDFTTSLSAALGKFAPGVNSALILEAGATGVREVVSSGQLPGVLLAYNQAIMNAFYLGAAGAAFASCAGWGMGITQNMRKKKPEPAAGTV
ncbi:MFS general substrate transporter-6 [Coleophoma cylindrospora]|uniref:MFS general substrate transporter-6 n=1 Tax=Coleophoma cylindrospora TaxID=1849047 RepID=A0A3D8QC57_9HELO|nr:MFS general substrate transporter-6 [Coleophoma cylindrospora]